jgi:Tfp pilus assembly protein PilX
VTECVSGTYVLVAVLLLLLLLLLLTCPGLRVPHPGRRMQQDEADEMAMMAGPPMGTGV